MNFENQKILITGGSSGIGKAMIARLYEMGARDIAVIGRDRHKLEALGTSFPDARFIYLDGDVSNPANIKAAIVKIEQAWDSLDILINNAGVVSAGPLEEISDEDIIAMQNINTTGLILLTKHALPLLKKSPAAVVMNVSSGLGLVGMAFYTPYAATKAAVRQFSEALRRELTGLSIHVMTVYPTATDTPMMHTAKTSGMDTPELVASQAIEGLIHKEIDIIMGGQAMLQNRKLNFEAPLQLDEKLQERHSAMKDRATGHRAM